MLIFMLVLVLVLVFADDDVCERWTRYRNELLHRELLTF